MAKQEVNETSARKAIFRGSLTQRIMLAIFVASVVLSYLKFPSLVENNWSLILINLGGILIIASTTWLRFSEHNYRWMISPFVLTLLFLVDIAWAKSVLTIEVNENLKLEKISLDRGSTLYIEYPVLVLYDSQDLPVLSFWLTAPMDSFSQELIVSSSDDLLLFAIQTADANELSWKESIERSLVSNGAVIRIVLQPNQTIHQVTQIGLSVNGRDIDQADLPLIRWEDENRAKFRLFASTLLDPSSVISLMIGIVAMWIEGRRKEEERRELARKKQDEIIKSIEQFEKDFGGKFPEALEKYINLTNDWFEWEEASKDKVREKLHAFMEQHLFWTTLSNRTISDLVSDIEQYIRLYTTCLDHIPNQLILLHDAIEENTSELLMLVREYPESIAIARLIARNLSDELKQAILYNEQYQRNYQRQIIDLKDELGFIEQESFPLRAQLTFSSGTPNRGEQLAFWLQKHHLRYSPFMDALNPYSRFPTETSPKDDRFADEDKFFIDLVSTGFTFPILESQIKYFSFFNAWDAGAALFEYVRKLPPKIKKDAFLVRLDPTIFTDFGMEQPREILLHALAEKWLWILAETPTVYYSLKEAQRSLLGRLICWHNGSPSAVVNTLENYMGKPNHDKGRSKNFLERIMEWIRDFDTTSLRTEELNALIELRPSPKRQTLLLISSANMTGQYESKISIDQHKILDSQANWLDNHGWALVHFTVSKRKPQRISVDDLVNQCSMRIWYCSNQEPDRKVEGFDALFSEHGMASADKILARKARGSPGQMVRLGQKLLLQHIAQHADEAQLHIEDLENLED